MGLRQEFEKAYKKWKEEERKIGVTPQNYKTLFLKMEKLKKDLFAFAVRFEKAMAPSAKMSDKIAEDIYKDIRDNFVGKIAKAKIVVDLSDVADKKQSDKEKNEMFRLYEELEKDFDDFPTLVDFFNKEYYDFSQLGSIILRNIHHFPDLNLNGIMFDFFSDIFKTFSDELRIDEQLLADDTKDFYDVENIGYVSKFIKYLFPEYWKRTHDDKHIIESAPENIKIFPKGKPLPSEVEQCEIGDCYLMATLIALAKKNPRAITKCFVQGLDKIENEKNIKIRLYYTDRKTYIFKPVIITIDKTKVIDPKAIKNAALWPKLIEKAYAVYRKRNFDLPKYSKRYNEQGKLSNGEPDNIMEVITGESAHIYKNKKDIIDGIKINLDKNHALTCIFKKKFITQDIKSGEKIQIYDGHVYAVVGIDESKKYVRLVNPWKDSGLVDYDSNGDPIFNGRIYKDKTKSQKSKEEGHIAMSFDDFEKNYDDVSYTTGKRI